MLYLSFCYFSLLLIKYDEKTSMPLSIFLWDLVHRNLYQFDWRTITEPSSYFQISYILNNAVMSNTFEQHPWSFDRYKSWKAKFGVKKHSHCHILINCLPERCISFTVPSYPLIMLLAHFPTPSSVPPSMRVSGARLLCFNSLLVRDMTQSRDLRYIIQTLQPPVPSSVKSGNEVLLSHPPLHSVPSLQVLSITYLPSPKENNVACCRGFCLWSIMPETVIDTVLLKSICRTTAQKPPLLKFHAIKNSKVTNKWWRGMCFVETHCTVIQGLKGDPETVVS